MPLSQGQGHYDSRSYTYFSVLKDLRGKVGTPSVRLCPQGLGLVLVALEGPGGLLGH